MATPHLPSTYATKYRQIIELLYDSGESLSVEYATIQALRHDRNYFYGYRRAVQRRYDSLVSKRNPPPLLAAEIEDLAVIICKIPHTQLKVDEANLTITFIDPTNETESDALSAALANRTPNPAPAAGRKISHAIIDELPEEEHDLGASFQQPLDVIGKLPSTAELLGINSTEVDDDTPVPEPIAEPPAADATAKRIHSLRTAYENISKKETLTTKQEKMLKNIVAELVTLDETFITPEMANDLDAIETKSKEFNI